MYIIVSLIRQLFSVFYLADFAKNGTILLINNLI